VVAYSGMPEVCLYRNLFTNLKLSVMKTIMQNTILAAILFTSVGSMANGPESTFGKKAFEVERNIINVNFDPVFKKKGDKLFINVLNLDQNNITLKVYDSAGRVVFKETIKGELIVEKAFNFENAYEDSYTVLVIDDKKTFKERFQVK